MAKRKLNCIKVACFFCLLPLWPACTPIVHGASFFSTSQDSLTALFSQALRLQQEKRYPEAENKLRRLLEVAPAFIDEQEGSTWYLLSQIVLAQKGKEEALNIYLTGLGTLKLHGFFDPFLGDACVQMSVQLKKEAYYELVTETFYRVLDEANPRYHHDLLERLYQQSAFFLSKEQREQIEKSLRSRNLEDHSGQLLRQYWRSQDPTPTTLLNERLIEHLQRIQHALEWYPSSNARGFDDRGMIYIKLGRPAGKASTEITASDAKRNYNYLPHEVWFYEHVAANLYFPFVYLQDRRGYVLVDGIEKAIPRPRVSNLWKIKLRDETPDLDSRLVFYQQLARSSPIFDQRIQDLEALRGEHPSYANIQAVHHMAYFDRGEEIYREHAAPKAVSKVLSDIEELSVLVRTARFREQNGTTRLELYLGLRESELTVKPLVPQTQSRTDTLLVKFAATVEDQTLWPRSTNNNTMVVFTQSSGPKATRSAKQSKDDLLQQLTVVTKLDSFYVSGQVESWLATAQGDVDSVADMTEHDLNLRSLGMLKLASFRTDLQRALRQDSSQLLISDLQLSGEIIPQAEHPTPNKGGLYVKPYPFQRVDRRKPLFLYFEIYGLRLLPQGEARYRIAYKVAEFDQQKSIWARIKDAFGGGKGEVELESEYSTATSNTPEWIALDLQELSPGEVKLTVKVADLNSRDTAERAITFELF